MISRLAQRADWPRCFPVMVHLRPHLDLDTFLAQVERQSETGFALAFVEDEEQVRGVAGFRLIEMLAHGRFLYVDDLVTDPTQRSRGYGHDLMNWLINHAREQNCASLQLDSGVHRKEAHRFYFTNRLTIASYHFSVPLNP